MQISAALIYIFPAFLNLCQNVPIDNGVEGEPEIDCGSSSLSINFNLRNNFEGHVYVKGRYAEQGCRSDEGGRKVASVIVPFASCGVERTRSLNPKGVFVRTTVVITFHPQFLTKVDRAYSIQCFYMEADKTVSQQLDVSELTTLFQSHQVPMPVCRYDILDAGPAGQAVKYATIGQQVYHKWTCDTETVDTFCMIVHSCFVNDGSDNVVSLLGEDGCAKDRYLLQNIEYTTDLMAGRESHVFKYADKAALMFNCQITLSIKEPGQMCPRPQCGEAPSPLNGGGSSSSSVGGQPPASAPIVGSPSASAAVRPPYAAKPAPPPPVQQPKPASSVVSSGGAGYKQSAVGGPKAPVLRAPAAVAAAKAPEVLVKNDPVVQKTSTTTTSKTSTTTSAAKTSGSSQKSSSTKSTVSSSISSSSKTRIENSSKSTTFQQTMNNVSSTSQPIKKLADFHSLFLKRQRLRFNHLNKREARTDDDRRGDHVIGTVDVSTQWIMALDIDEKDDREWQNLPKEEMRNGSRSENEALSDEYCIAPLALGFLITATMTSSIALLTIAVKVAKNMK